MSWFGHVVGKGANYSTPQGSGGAGDVYVEVYGKAPEGMPIPKLPDREEIIGGDYSNAMSGFYESIHSRLAHHYRNLGSEFFREHPREALQWARLDPEVFRLYSPVSVVRQVDSVEVEDRGTHEQPEWKIKTNPVVVSHSEKVHLIRPEQEQYDENSIPLVTPDGHPVGATISGDEGLSVTFHDDGNQGVFLCGP